MTELERQVAEGQAQLRYLQEQRRDLPKVSRLQFRVP